MPAYGSAYANKVNELFGNGRHLKTEHLMPFVNLMQICFFVKSCMVLFLYIFAAVGTSDEFVRPDFAVTLENGC